MQTTTNDKNDQSKNSDSWGLDTNSLDDWLENDLKQSSLFKHHNKQPDNKTKCSLSHIITQDIPLQKDESIHIKETSNNYEEEESLQRQTQSTNDNNNTTTPPLPIHLTRLVKIYSLLNTVARQNNNKREQVHSNLNYTAPIDAPPSPIMSVSSNSKASEKIVKRKRGNNRTPVNENIKRQRNTDAARRSRLKKTIKMESLEKKVDELKTDNDRLRVKVAVLETEVCHVTEKEKNNRQRVLELEAQLANAHSQLVKDFKKSE